MGYSMWSINCVALHIDEEYLEGIKKDIKEFKENENFLLGLTEKQKGLFLTFVEDEEIMDSTFEDFTSDYCESFNQYDSGKYSDNYAEAAEIDLSTGKIGDFDSFDGYVYEISYISSSIYSPLFKDKEDLISEIDIYIPKNYNLDNHIIYLTGVNGG